jgi:hypothetical protein
MYGFFFVNLYSKNNKSNLKYLSVLKVDTPCFFLPGESIHFLLYFHQIFIINLHNIFIGCMVPQRQAS